MPAVLLFLTRDAAAAEPTTLLCGSNFLKLYSNFQSQGRGDGRGHQLTDTRPQPMGEQLTANRAVLDRLSATTKAHKEHLLPGATSHPPPLQK